MLSASINDHAFPIFDADNKKSLMQALRRCRAVICTGKLGALPEALASSKQIQHVVLLTSTGASGPAFLPQWLLSRCLCS